MTSPPSEDRDRLLDEAILLMIRHQEDPSNPVALDMIETWSARSPEHEEVWTVVARAHGASGTILQEKRRRERRESLGLTRRNFLIGGPTVLVAGAAGYTAWNVMLSPARADYVTRKGEKLEIDLPLGGRATLGPDSAIALNFDETQSEVRLLHGMCFFEMPSTQGHIFSVTCETLKATASGASFDVTSDSGIVSVSVDRGTVALEAAQSALAPDETLEDGNWLSLNISSGEIRRGRGDTISSWRNDLIIAEELPISVLIDRIGRWIPGQVVSVDPFIGRQKVSGVYDLTKPLLALQAVVHPTGAQVRQFWPSITVISPL